METLTELAQNSQFPIVAAFALGLLTAISPCPLATNITATAYIARTLKNKRHVMWSGVFYTIGRGLSYTLIALILYWGASKFQVARFFQSKGELFLGPLMLLIGLIMLRVIKFNIFSTKGFTDRIAERFKDRGQLGALALGVIFALAFCPYSGALYFGMLIPMTLQSASGLHLPLVFALGTGIPVILFAWLLAYSASRMGKMFNAIQKTERIMRFIAGIAFIITGLYYILIALQWI